MLDKNQEEAGIKMVEFTPELKQSFLDMLDNHKDENDIQRFLEEHTEMIPLPFLEGHGLNDNAIISKLKLGSEMTTDFAYLTKCSDYWNFVLVEIEDSRKELFIENKQRVMFSAKFNNAYDQILAWKAYIEHNRERLLYQTEKIRFPLQNNPVRFKYVLIIGRNAEKEKSEHKTRMFAQKNTDDTKVMTYDSIISYCEKAQGLYRKLILSPVGDQGFKIKSVPEGINTSLFSWVTSEYIRVEQPQINQLKAQGYDIDSWLKGKQLVMNGRYTHEEGWERIKAGKSMWGAED